MIEKIKQPIDNLLYSYDPNEYLPIYEEGELANRSAFIAYKAKRVMQHIGHGAVVAIETWADAQERLSQVAK